MSASAASSSFPAYKYIISKRLDPLFAVAVGLSAAGVRIRREEREKGHAAGDTLAALRRRAGFALGAGGGAK